MARPRSGETLRSIDQVEEVIDADGHVTTPASMLLPYMDEAFDDVREFYERSPQPAIEFNPGSVATSTYLYERMKEREGKEGFSFSKPLGVDALKEVMDEHGIDRAVVNNLGFCPRRNARHAAGIANAYNNWMLEEFADHPDVYGNLLGTTLDPEFTAAEMRRLQDEDSVVAVQFLGSAFRPLPSKPRFDPVWEAAEETGLVVAIHTGTGPRSFPEQFWTSETYAEDHVSAHPMQHISLLTAFVFGGVLERHPDLTVVMQEAGIGYIPYVKQRFDAAYLELGYEIPELNRRPSEYIDDQVFFCSQPLGHTHGTPQHIAELIELAGVGNVMWSADIPHPDFDTPEELFNRVRSYFTASELHDLMGKNAERVYGL